MKILIAEDDAVSSKVLECFLAPLGACECVKNGKLAIDAVRRALAEDKPYDLICLDIMMPEVDGQGALTMIRALEANHDKMLGEGAKILMTTALGDSKNVLSAFKENCDGYMVKPIDKAKLMTKLKDLGLPLPGIP